MNRSVSIDSRPALSVVVATTKRWPEISACMDSLLSQTKRCEAELIIADGDGQGLSDEFALANPGVIWLKKPGASVFVLRKLAMCRARGEVIAVTEDHCVVSPNWCEQIIRSHQDFPQAAAIGGTVENGATTRLIDWANFFLVFAPFIAPIQDGECNRICLQANISYKRRVIDRVISDLGVMEMLFNEKLRSEGESLFGDNRLVVSHVQSHGFPGTFAAHFHNGRSIAGFRLEQMKWFERLFRLSTIPILPPFLFCYTIRPLLRKRRLLPQLCVSLPLLAILVWCHAAGELAGYIAGPGESPKRLA